MVQTRTRRLPVSQSPSAHLVDDSDNDDESFDSDPPPRAKRRKVSASKASVSAVKKAKKGKGKGRGKTGKLAFILEAPTEIVLGILSYLTPLDILNLSYVDKELRAMMISPSSKSIWVAARENVPGLPECPADFTEAAYARFLFLKRCELCGAVAHGLASMCFVRIRLCTRCNKTNCVSGLNFVPRLLPPQQETSAWNLIPRGLPYNEDDFPAKSNVVFKPAAERLRQRLVKIPPGDERELFIKERRELIDKVMIHAAELSSWLSNVRDAKGRDVEDIRAERLQNIFTRLLELGYERRDMIVFNVLDHRVVRQPVQLTDKLWPTVRRHLEPIVQRNQGLRILREGHARIESHLRTRFRAMWNSLTTPLEKYTYIPVLDFLQLPAVTSIINASLVDPANIDTDQLNKSIGSNIAAINEEILQFRIKMRKDLFVRWTRRNVKKALPACVIEALEADNITVRNRMRLATTVFQYSRSFMPGCTCRQPIHYATLFKARSHSASCLCSSISRRLDVQPALTQKWSHYLRHLTSNRIITAHMTTIVRGAGLDVEASTLNDLETLGSYRPIRKDESAHVSESSGSSGASPMTTWLAEYNRLIGSNPIFAPTLILSDGELYSDYGDDSDMS